MMKDHRFVVWMLVAVLQACSGPEPMAPVDVPEGFVALSNGVDLSGWHGMGHVDPSKLESMSTVERAEMRARDMEELLKHWKVENGEIVNDGEGPYLTTDLEYGDIELLLEYRTVAGADSGVYLRSTPQVQIWDYTEEGGKWPLGADKGSGGLWNNSDGADGKFPLVRADRPFGEWNRLRVLQIGERTTVHLNDQLVVDHARMENYWDPDRPLRKSGHVQLQTHGGEIRWRHLFLRQVPSSEATDYLVSRRGDGFEQIFDGSSFQGWAGPIEEYNIENGVLMCRPGQGGTIYYDQELTDFQVRLEFQLPPGGNNGLAIRYPGKGDTAYDGMCELQVIDNTAERYASLDPRQFHGSAYGMVAAHRGYQRAVGDWNYQEVTVRGSTIEVELNGTHILNADLSRVDEVMDHRPHPGKDRTSGFFGFAGHSDPVKYRNIYLKRLD